MQSVLSLCLAVMGMQVNAFTDFEISNLDSECFSGDVACSLDEIEAAEDWTVGMMKTELVQTEAKHVPASEKVKLNQQPAFGTDTWVDEFSDDAVAALAKKDSRKEKPDTK
eukprot:TRINITY_DN53054_c0_g1_i1.p1 TRINITY_DN53054_c0_g1~~TRINITY_DN53054_c0_g1_i1.p1  ORF type:complete len:111 (-),score=35.73 TRINITY_DN53054_c0_g1_i1:79-411(-)